MIYNQKKISKNINNLLLFLMIYFNAVFITKWAHLLCENLSTRYQSFKKLSSILSLISCQKAQSPLPGVSSVEDPNSNLENPQSKVSKKKVKKVRKFRNKRKTKNFYNIHHKIEESYQEDYTGDRFLDRDKESNSSKIRVDDQLFTRKSKKLNLIFDEESSEHDKQDSSVMSSSIDKEKSSSKRSSPERALKMSPEFMHKIDLFPASLDGEEKKEEEFSSRDESSGKDVPYTMTINDEPHFSQMMGNGLQKVKSKKLSHDLL